MSMLITIVYNCARPRAVAREMINHLKLDIEKVEKFANEHSLCFKHNHLVRSQDDKRVSELKAFVIIDLTNTKNLEQFLQKLGKLFLSYK